MTDKPENPPAFPGGWPEASYEPHYGMTLRDWFASHAPEPPGHWWGVGGSKTCAGYAQWNYQYADAMLALRVE